MLDENEIHHELYIHLLCSTKNQQPVITPSLACFLYRYICEQALSCDCHVIGGQVFSDHFQLVVKFTPEVSVLDLMMTLKTATSLWMRTNYSELKQFEWQKSDFAFSISYEEVGTVIDKINRAKSFIDEIYPLLEAMVFTEDLQEVLE